MKKQLRLSLLLLLLSLACATGGFAQSACGGSPTNVPPAESCPEVCIYCDFNGYMGSTEGYAPNGIPPGGFCSMIQNDQWLGFIAGAASATFSVIPSNCENGNGVQVALYEGCTTAPLACNPGCNGCGNVTTTIAVSMVVGTNYFLLIDGLSGDICDLRIDVSPPSAVQAPPVGPLAAIQGRDTVCPGATVQYQIPNVTGAGTYTWSTTTPGVTFNGKFSPAQLDAPDGRIVEVVFPSNLPQGPVQLCVNANNSCNSGGTRCRTIQVKPLPVNVLPPVTIGPSQLPYTLPWGDEVTAAGTYETTFSSSLGCDSTVRLQLMVCQKTTTLPAREFCIDTCVSVCGQLFCKTGNYSVKCGTSATCDSLVNFSLTIAGPPQIQPGTYLALTCKDTALTLNATSGGNIAWYNQKNQLLGTTNSLKVSVPGIYTATSLLPGGTECGSRSVQVKQNKQKPAITAKGGALTPNMTTVTLMAKSTTSGVLYFWKGPAGFSSQQRNPTVSVAGFYTVTVIDPANGCSNSATVEVTGG